MRVEGVGLRGDGGWLEFEVESGGGEGEVGLEGHFSIFYFLLFWASFLLFCFLGGSVGGFESMGLCICIVWMRMGIMGVLLLLLSSVIDVPALAGEVEAGWLFYGALIGFDWI